MLRRNRSLLQNHEDMSAKSLFTVHAIAALVVLSLGLRAQAPSTVSADSSVNTITVHKLALELQKQGVLHWRVVLAQAIVETGWDFNSALYQRTHNFIGMRVPGSRPSTRNGEHKGYSSYATWQDCVADIKIWQDHFWKGGSRQQYLDKISRVWAQAPDYVSHLHKLIARFDQEYPDRA